MVLFSSILYFIGYTFDLNANISDPPLDIELGRNSTYVARPRTVTKENQLKKSLRYIYNILIITLMLWIIPYSVYISYNKHNFIYFGRTWFQFLFAYQYYKGIHYFSKNHFYENIVTNSKLMNYIKYTLPFTSLLTISLTIINIILLVTGFYIFGYTDIYNNADLVGKVFISLLLILESLYSYQTFTVNACVFVINMVYHKLTVSEYSDNLNDYIKNSVSIGQKLNIIAKEYSQMKDKFDQTVALLTPFFSSLNFIGFITIYFYLRLITIEKTYISPNEIINIILFIIVEAVYLTSIQTVNSKVNKICDIATSNSIIAFFFTNKNFITTIPTFDSNVNNLKKTKKEITDGITENLSENDFKNNNEENNYDNNISYDIHNLNISLETYMNKMHNILKQNLTTSISTDQMVDWLLLQSIVSGSWRTFRLFGIEFTDSKLISRLFGLAVTILLTAETGAILNWW